MVISKSGKIKRDVNAPKKAMSAFMLWSNRHRDAVKQEHPEAKLTELSQYLGQRWGTLSDQEKAAWQDVAATEKEKYNILMSAYKQTADYHNYQAQKKAALKALKDNGPMKGRRGRKKDIDANEPKKPSPAYLHFSREKRPDVIAANTVDNQQPDFAQIGRCLGQAWAACPPELKQKYERMAETDKARYQREMAIYKASKAQGVHPHVHQQHAHSHAHAHHEEEEEEDESD